MLDNKIQKDDIVHFLDLVNSSYSPNFKLGHSKIGKPKPYYKILKEEYVDSLEYQSFIKVYLFSRHVLNEQELYVLNHTYGVSGEFYKGTQIAKMLNLSNTRIRAVRVKGEQKISTFLRKQLNKVH
ncbi:hypothetical protein [Bacillus suaedaesalsae]|uniref:RNA polymerase sigma-70 region 4 domain-containing protein n=1 Tax=Bacillus suaedaesalsae TaxID=2810349 RepID=A0ABS2DFN1_9BACI|nr:hypothetical protein [Bacillus suaedaesalsae]MBM6617285.1 hypothetical protein [Bacillus suaedaesalsae]